MATLTPTHTLGKANLTPAFASGNFRVQKILVDTSAMTLFSNADTNNVDVADIPKGTIILGTMVDPVTPATNAGTSICVIKAGGASGTALTGNVDMTAAVGTATAGAVTSNAYVAAASTTLTCSFTAGTAANTVNPKFYLTLYLGG